jgi:hypothetical protein
MKDSEREDCLRELEEVLTCHNWLPPTPRAQAEHLFANRATIHHILTLYGRKA